MKKIPCILIVGLLVVMVSSCSPSSSEGTEPLEKPTEESSAPVDETDVLSEEPLFDKSAIIAEFQDVIASCNDILLDFDGSLQGYSLLSNAIGSQGYPVYYYDLDMPNYEVVEAFWRNAEEGSDSQVTIYCLHNRRITANILVCKDNELFLNSNVYYEYLGDGEIAYSGSVVLIDDMRMTEKGYLLYRTPKHGGYDESYGGYRITPLGDEKRELGRKYIQGIGYYPNGMLRYNWDAGDLSALNLEWVFESLYFKVNGTYPYEDYTETDTERRVLIPGSIVEDLMLNIMPVSTEQLRASIAYYDESNSYAYWPFEGGGYSPLSEVVDFQRNEDGSLSIYVDAAAIEFGDDIVMKNVITVIDNPDGFKYLSNVVIQPYE